VPGLILVPTFPFGLLPISVDVTRSLTDDTSLEVAEHPVEGAESVTDEMLTRPRQVSYELTFSDAPPGIIPQGKDRAEKLVQQLRALAERKALITAVTPDEAITRLVITNLKVARDASTGKRRPVSLSLTRVRIVSLELVAAVVDADLAALGQVGSVDQGLQP
jgi:hypothetical protein